MVDGGELGVGGAVDRRDVDGGGGGKLYAVGAITLEHVSDVVGHGGGDGAGDAVVNDGEAEESVGNGMGFYMVFCGEGIDEAVEVGDVGIFDAVVVDAKGEVDGVDGVREEGRLELVVAVGQQEGCDLLVGMEARLLKTGNGFVAAGVKKGFAVLVKLNEWVNAETGEDGRGEQGGVDNYEFRGGHVVAEIKIGDIEGAKVGVLGRGGVEENVDHRHRACAGGNRVRNVASVSPSTATNSADDCSFLPLLLGYRVVVSGGFGTDKDGGDGFGVEDQFNELDVIFVEPKVAVRPSEAGFHGDGIAMDVEVEVVRWRGGGGGGSGLVCVCGGRNRRGCRRHTRCSCRHTRSSCRRV